MSDGNPPKLSPCGCCASEPPPPAHENRPGLPALNYRIGTHASFLRRMLGRLSLQEIPEGPHQGARPLAALSTRATDDPTIALLDAWAMSADVLTFYQERIANEGFLRTATERRSILELARAIGYELKPGVAAEAWLAFEVDEAEGSPKETAIERGVKVMSVPGPDEKPQTFETVEPIEARAGWNQLRPRLKRPQELAIRANDSKLYLLGLSARFPEGTPEVDAGEFHPLDANVALPAGKVQALEVTQAYLQGTTTNLKAGDRLLAVGRKPGTSAVTTVVLRVHRVEPDAKLDRTRVDFAPTRPPPPPFSRPAIAKGTVFSAKVPLTGGAVQQNILSASWSNADLNALFYVQAWAVPDLLRFTPRSQPPQPADPGMFAFRGRAGFFGHNAPRWETLPDPKFSRAKTVTTTPASDDPYKKNWNAGEGPSVWQNSQGTDYGDPNVYLERAIPELVAPSWTIFENPGKATAYRVEGVVESSLADYGLSGKATGLTLSNADGSSPATEDAAFFVRNSTAHVQSDRLLLAELPIEDRLEPASTTLMLHRLVPDLRIGQVLILSGEREDFPGVTGHEALRITDIAHDAGFTSITFEALATKAGLEHPYVRSTVTLNANVARATHGETVHEVLGSGNRALANQKFFLKRPPLTHVSAKTPTGSRAELTLRVNNVAWTQVPSLFGEDGRSQSYSVRIDDDARVTLQFGDGVRGARLPTGVGNVTAFYRTGLGPEGEVKAGSLTVLMTRPAGVRAVNNPLPAGGAEAPEARDDARQNAPSTVLTLERVVSLRDFEDFARAFAGISKARAEALWHEQNYLVLLTVSTAGGQAPVGGDPLLDTLREALDAQRDPSVALMVLGFRPALFRIGAGLRLDPRYEFETVRAAADAALRQAFGFVQRDFAQPVSAAEVITLLQSVAGVAGVDLNTLQNLDPARTARLNLDPVWNSLLPAEPAHFDPASKSFVAAELLLLDPLGVDLKETKP